MKKIIASMLDISHEQIRNIAAIKDYETNEPIYEVSYESNGPQVITYKLSQILNCIGELFF
jgi:hypothetical protein